MTSLFACDFQVTLPVPTNPVVLKKAAAVQAAKEQKEAKEAKAKEKAAAAAAIAGDDTQKEDKPKEMKLKSVEEKQSKQDQKEEKPKETDEEEEKPIKETLPASWLKPVKWFMGQFAKENGKLKQWKTDISTEYFLFPLTLRTFFRRACNVSILAAAKQTHILVIFFTRSKIYVFPIV